MVNFVEDGKPITAFEAVEKKENKFGQRDDQNEIGNFEGGR